MPGTSWPDTNFEITTCNEASCRKFLCYLSIFSLTFSHQFPHSTGSNSVRRNRGRENVIKEPIQASAEPYSRSGIDDCGKGSGENNYNGSTTVTVQHPRLTADLFPNDHTRRGHKLKAKDTSSGSPLLSPSSAPSTPHSLLQQGTSPLESCSQLTEESTTLLIRVATCRTAAGVASTESPSIFDTSHCNTIHDDNDAPRPHSVASESIKSMATTDTRRDATNASYVEQCPSTTITHSMATTCQDQTTDRDICKFHGSAPMDIDVATATQSSQVRTGVIC